MRAREAVEAYHAAQERANRAALGSGEYRDALAEVSRLYAELLALGIDANATWREGTRRKFRLDVLGHRPGRKGARQGLAARVRWRLQERLDQGRRPTGSGHSHAIELSRPLAAANQVPAGPGAGTRRDVGFARVQKR